MDRERGRFQGMGEEMLSESSLKNILDKVDMEMDFFNLQQRKRGAITAEKPRSITHENNSYDSRPLTSNRGLGFGSIPSSYESIGIREQEPRMSNLSCSASFMEPILDESLSRPIIAEDPFSMPYAMKQINTLSEKEVYLPLSERLGGKSYGSSVAAPSSTRDIDHSQKLNATILDDPERKVCCTFLFDEQFAVLDRRELLDVFADFGPVAGLELSQDKKAARISFEHVAAATDAIHIMNNSSLSIGGPKLRVEPYSGGKIKSARESLENLMDMKIAHRGVPSIDQHDIRSSRGNTTKLMDLKFVRSRSPSPKAIRRDSIKSRRSLEESPMVHININSRGLSPIHRRPRKQSPIQQMSHGRSPIHRDRHTRGQSPIHRDSRGHTSANLNSRSCSPHERRFSRLSPSGPSTSNIKDKIPKSRGHLRENVDSRHNSSNRSQSNVNKERITTRYVAPSIIITPVKQADVLPEFKEIKQVFAEFGRVKGISRIKRSKHAFITYFSNEAAQNSIRCSNGKKLSNDMPEIRVVMATEKNIRKIFGNYQNIPVAAAKIMTILNGMKIENDEKVKTESREPKAKVLDPVVKKKSYEEFKTALDNDISNICGEISSAKKLSGICRFDPENPPRYDADEVFGMEYLDEVKSFACRACQRELQASEVDHHCKSQRHYESILAQLKNEEAPKSQNKSSEEEDEKDILYTVLDDASDFEEDIMKKEEMNGDEDFDNSVEKPTGVINGKKRKIADRIKF